MLGAVDHRARHDAVLQHAAVGIDVAQEQVERRDALLQTALDALPFRRRDDARQKVGRDDPLGRLVVGIDREGDALVQEGLLAGLLAADELVRRQRRQPAVERGVMIAALRRHGREHLVIRRAQRIGGIGSVLARPAKPSRLVLVRSAEVFCMGEGFLLHLRSGAGGASAVKPLRQTIGPKGRFDLPNGVAGTS